MEKTMYPQVPEIPGVPDAPPSYSQTYHPAPSASAPSPEFMPIPLSGQMMSIPPQQQQSFAQPQPVYIQSGAIPPLGPQPCLVTCPSCHQQQMSKLRTETATKTHLFAALLCILGLCCCVCVPYCMDTCKNVNHYCSNCDAYLGMYNK